GGLVFQPLRARTVAMDRGLGVLPISLPELLGAAHVVRDRDEDGEAVAEGAVDGLEHVLPAGLVLGEQRVDQQRRVAGLRREAGDLRAELPGMPLRMP